MTLYCLYLDDYSCGDCDSRLAVISLSCNIETNICLGCYKERLFERLDMSKRYGDFAFARYQGQEISQKIFDFIKRTKCTE